MIDKNEQTIYDIDLCVGMKHNVVARTLAELIVDLPGAQINALLIMSLTGAKLEDRIMALNWWFNTFKRIPDEALNAIFNNIVSLAITDQLIMASQLESTKSKLEVYMDILLANDVDLCIKQVNIEGDVNATV